MIQFFIIQIEILLIVQNGRIIIMKIMNQRMIVRFMAIVVMAVGIAVLLSGEVKAANSSLTSSQKATISNYCQNNAWPQLAAFVASLSSMLQTAAEAYIMYPLGCSEQYTQYTQEHSDQYTQTVQEHSDRK